MRCARYGNIPSRERRHSVGAQTAAAEAVTARDEPVHCHCVLRLETYRAGGQRKLLRQGIAAASRAGCVIFVRAATLGSRRTPVWLCLDATTDCRSRHADRLLTLPPVFLVCSLLMLSAVRLSHYAHI